MAFDGLNFAGAVVKLDTVAVGKITSWTETVSVSEEMVSGSEDTLGAGANKIIKEKYSPTSQGVTANVEGIYIPSNTGQSDLRTAAKNGDEVDLEHEDQSGYGTDMTGFFTNFEITGQLQGVYTFSAQFRANSDTNIAPAG